EHHRRLEAASDAEPDAAEVAPCGDVGTVEVHPPARRCRESADDVDERGLAGSVRADQEPQLAPPDSQLDVMEGAEALELGAHVAPPAAATLASRSVPASRTSVAWRRRSAATRRPSAAAMPMIPPGAKARTAMNSAPWTYCQSSGLAPDTESLAQLTASAPK